jgi:hypothetical protein
VVAAQKKAVVCAAFHFAEKAVKILLRGVENEYRKTVLLILQMIKEQFDARDVEEERTKLCVFQEYDSTMDATPECQ